MSEISNDYIKNIFYDISKTIIIPKFQNLKKKDIQFKNKTEIVTSVDIKVEKRLKKILLDILPQSLFVGEESYNKNNKIIKAYKENKFCWTVDPIDGTKNFVRGNYRFAIMVALTFKDQIIQSWIYKPLTNEFCYSKFQEGSFINDKEFKILKNVNISNAVGSISSKYWDNNYDIKIQSIKNKFKKIDSYGCIGFEYIDILKEIRDFTILSKLFPWDHIPGILFIKEAGGSVLHFDKSQYNHSNLKKNLIVTNSSNLMKKIINLIKE